MNSSDEIKSKLDIVDIIREYIPLKPAGVNFRANCPFHREKTPSFVVSPEKQIFHCFGCGKGGDIFTFVMEMDGISFVDALRDLAPKAGVTLKKQDPKLTSQRNRLLDILEFSRIYYHNILLEKDIGKPARKYLTQRGLDRDAMEEWQIGFSPDSWDDLIKLLLNKGFTENEIFLAGISGKKEGSSRFYNRFRGRVMFPINGINGNTVAFSARVSPDKEKDEKMGKYINSPQTMIYDKSNILFGLDKAKKEIKSKDYSIIVEGQMDVITAHVNGYKNVVASSGTALTKGHISLIKRYSSNLLFALDSDLAGLNATNKGDELIKDENYKSKLDEAEDSSGKMKKYINPSLSEDINIKIIKIPNGKDPDECIRNNKLEWEEAVRNAKPVMQFYFDKTFTNLDTSNIENKRKAVKELLPILARINNKIEQDHWLGKLSQTIDAREEILRETLNELLASKQKREFNQPNPPAGGVEKKEKISREEMLSELFLALTLKFPEFIEYSINHIQPNQVLGQRNIGLYRSLTIYYNNLIDNWTRMSEAQAETHQAPPDNVDSIKKTSTTEETDYSTGQVSYAGFKSWLEKFDDSREGFGETNNQYEKKEDTNGQLQILDKLVILGDKEFFEYDTEKAKNELINIIVNLKKYYLVSKRKKIEKLIAQAEEEGNEEYLKNLMEEFKVLTEEIVSIGN